MKTIGLIGGMSWESTQVYYRLLNEKVKQSLGGHHSAKVVLVSVDFAEIAELQHAGDWPATETILCDAAQALERAGADFILIGTNTMHKIADEVAAAVSVPLLHIIDVTAAALKARSIKRVGLLGTQFTMEQEFYRARLQAQGVEIVIPEPEERELVHSVIFDELCQGQFLDASKQAYLKIIKGLAARGAEGVILGCTEIGMLLQDGDASIPLFDTAELHAEAAVSKALS
ncbi:aspartate/glutamate racemase [Aliidiomarina shirensis]|uniref:Aspartate/glutamate racemase n=1 Tax=Aliidiomarina shirensis TaxID=1048642 RepID=A0A432WWL6_9GAMM|nr:aspartate/glutamate racemase family protein [Aliidiomarina shirensis]RUO38139.1 aspartate/glutamate racemase [Aliidiomarina shirensis]